MGLVAPCHPDSSWTKDWTRVAYIGRWILNHWTTQEVLHSFYNFWSNFPFIGFSDSSVGKESTCNAEDPSLVPELGKSVGGDRLPTPVFLGFPCGSACKESACHVGDLGLIPGLGRSPGEGKGYPLQYSGLENSMDCIAHGIAKSWTRLNEFHFH